MRHIIRSCYPQVHAWNDVKVVFASYHDPIVRIPAGWSGSRLIAMNGRLPEGLYVELDRPLGLAEVTLRKATGEAAGAFTLELASGLHHLPVPACGTVELVIKA